MEIQARFVKIGFRCRPVWRALNRIQYVVSNINAAHTVRGEPFGWVQDRPVEPLLRGRTLRHPSAEGQGERGTPRAL